MKKLLATALMGLALTLSAETSNVSNQNQLLQIENTRLELLKDRYFDNWETTSHDNASLRSHISVIYQNFDKQQSDFDFIIDEYSKVISVIKEELSIKEGLNKTQEDLIYNQVYTMNIQTTLLNDMKIDMELSKKALKDAHRNNNITIGIFILILVLFIINKVTQKKPKKTSKDKKTPKAPKVKKVKKAPVDPKKEQPDDVPDNTKETNINLFKDSPLTGMLKTTFKAIGKQQTKEVKKNVPTAKKTKSNKSKSNKSK